MSINQTAALTGKLDENLVISEIWSEAYPQVADAINNIIYKANKYTYGFHGTQEIVINDSYFDDNNNTSKSVYRKVVNFGALPNATNKAVAHDIVVDANTHFVNIYGSASNPSTSYIPLPYSSPTLNENISVVIDGTNVTITTGKDYSSYTVCFIVLEYLKR